MDHISILGAGLSGLAAAQRAENLGFDLSIYERNSYVGGRAYSHNLNGFIFDEGPHVSFTENDDIKKLFASSVCDKYFEFASLVFNCWKRLWLRHPVQDNLYGLPVELVERIVLDFISNYYCRDKGKSIVTYADWLYANLGNVFSEEFVFKYTRKYWTTDAVNLTSNWIGKRVHKPNIEQIIKGALSEQKKNLHYIPRFRYPEKGGFVRYVNNLVPRTKVQILHEVSLIDVKAKKIEFSNGVIAYYEHLISSLPITVLIEKIKDVPQYVKKASEKLACTSVELINIGIKKSESLPDYHWFYAYDEDISFTRGSFPDRLSLNNVPKGCQSLQLEVYHSKYKLLKTNDILGKVVRDLYKIGLLKTTDDIMLNNRISIPYANIIFDFEREKNLKVVKKYLMNNKIIVCGRYGEWDYFWSDDSVLSGFKAADSVIKQMSKFKKC